MIQVITIWLFPGVLIITVRLFTGVQIIATRSFTGVQSQDGCVHVYTAQLSQVYGHDTILYTCTNNHHEVAYR